MTCPLSLCINCPTRPMKKSPGPASSVTMSHLPVTQLSGGRAFENIGLSTKPVHDIYITPVAF